MQPQVGKTRSRRRLLTACAAIVLLCGAWAAAQGPAAPAAQPGIISIVSRPVPLDKNDPGRDSIGELAYLGGVQLQSEAAAFGGYSGLRLLPDGRLLAISDRGHWLTFRAVERQGRLVGVSETVQGPLLDETGRPLAYPHFDAEALEVVETAAGGLEILIAFEQHHRIWRYSSPDSAPVRIGMSQDSAPQGSPDVAELGKMFARTPAVLPWLEGWTGTLPANAGLEAMAVTANGAALLLAEGTGEGRFRPHAKAPWVPIRYNAEPGFKPTDAVFLPIEGRHLAVVVNRYFSILHGVAARLELVDLDPVLAPARDGKVLDGKVQGRLLARLAPPVSVDNMEAVAVAPHPGGGWSLYVMADDNQNPLQRTLLLKFHLPASAVLP